MAAEISPDVALYAVGAMITGALSVFGFLVKRSFVDLVEKVEGVGTKVEAIGASIAKHDTNLATVELRLAGVEAEVKLNRDRYHDLASDQTARLGRLDAQYESLINRMAVMEQTQREIREGR